MEFTTIRDGSLERLSQLALRPDEQLVDSAEYSELGAEYVLLSDTLGIAIRRPDGHRWSVGVLDSVRSVSTQDGPIARHYAEPLREFFTPDPLPPYHGVWIDRPTTVVLGKEARIDGIPIGENFFEVPAFQAAVRRFAELNDIGSAETERELNAMEVLGDSLIAANLPYELQLPSGVFVRRLRRDDIPPFNWGVYRHFDMLDNVMFAITGKLPMPRMVYLDKRSGIGAFNESHELRNVGGDTTEMVVNRAGYAIEAGDAAYVVMLQFTSNHDPETLDALEDLFSSVRLLSTEISGQQ